MNKIIHISTSINYTCKPKILCNIKKEAYTKNSVRTYEKQKATCKKCRKMVGI